MSISTSGSVMANRYNYYDLDPTYRNAFGQPLMRMTFDYKENEHKMSRHIGAGDQRSREVDESDLDEPGFGAHGSVVGGAVPEHAQHRRHHHGHQSTATARSTNTCRAGIATISSSWARVCSRTTRPTIRPVRSARSLTARRIRSRTSYLKNPGPLVSA